MVKKNSFYAEFVDRNIGVISSDEQEKLRKSCVAITGCGGMGGFSAEQLVRLGVGCIKIADYDKFEVHNLSRQFGSAISNIGQNKADVLSSIFKTINPEIKLDVYKEGLTIENVENFVGGADIIIDGMDYSSLKLTALLYEVSVKHGLCVINPNAIGFGVSVFVFGPKTMSFEEYTGLSATSRKEEILEKLVPYRPSYGDPEVLRKAALGEINIPNIIMPQHLGTAIAVSEAIMIILGRIEPPCGPNPRIIILDLQDRKFQVSG